MYATMSAGTTRTSRRFPGQRKFMKDQSRSSGHPAHGALPAAQLAALREPHDGTDEILFCRQLERLDARALELRRERLLAALHDLVETLAEATVGRVHPDMLAGLGIVHHDQADLGELALARVGQADRQHLMPAREQRQGTLPPRRGEEVRDHEDKGAP